MSPATPAPRHEALWTVISFVLLSILIIVGVSLAGGALDHMGGGGSDSCTNTLYDTTSSKAEAHSLCVQTGFEDEDGNQLR